MFLVSGEESQVPGIVQDGAVVLPAGELPHAVGKMLQVPDLDGSGLPHVEWRSAVERTPQRCV